MPEKKPFERLHRSVVPEHYDITLQPDLTALTFEGSLNITVHVKQTTERVVLNLADLAVKNVMYTGDQGGISDIQTEYNGKEETVTFTFPGPLKVGKGTLSVQFTGELNDKLKGFYRSKYTTLGGEERYGAVTQFAATDARRAFPCWDEPAVKATFDVTLVVQEDRVALSNMPVKKETALGGGLRSVQYERTPVMSTYLLAFVVGEYDFVENIDSDGVKVRVYTPVGRKEQGTFALEVAVKTLPFYKNYFSIAYPLPKIDLIAVADFAPGAMENWGLVTYRETALLVDKENSSSAARQRVALIVGHELAHMWFGNLVTMEWWTHLWLNEGFASWIEYLCVDHCFPEFDIWTQFVSTDFTRALELDGLRSSHPIEVPVGHPAEVDEIFDAISYSKGASIIRMLHDFIGDKDFRVGMNKYLSTHQYQNTCTEDLWRSLEEASGQPVQEVMATWTQRMGFPVLEVSQTQAGEERVLSITQHKFSADGRQDGASPLWLVPVSVSTASSPDQAVQMFVLRDSQTSIIIKGVKPEEWVKLNPGSVGYYRTQYSPDMLDSLIPAIKDMTLPPKDRLGLHNDLFALARAGKMATAEVLKVVEAFCAETNYTVWGDLASNLSGLAVILQYIDQQDNYNAFIRLLFSAIYTKLGWQKVEGEGHLDALLRSLVIGHMGRAGDQSVIEEARKRFSAHCKGTVPLPADLREPVYTTVLTHGGTSEYEAMLKLISETSLQEERLRIMKSLGAVKDEHLINRTLEYAMSEEVRSQDTVFVVAGVTGSVKGRELAWAFVKSHWSELQERYQGAFLLPRLVKCVSEKFASEEMIQDVKAFFDNHTAPGAERTVQQSLENIRLNIDQLNRDREALKEFLLKKNLSNKT